MNLSQIWDRFRLIWEVVQVEEYGRFRKASDEERAWFDIEDSKQVPQEK